MELLGKFHFIDSLSCEIVDFRILNFYLSILSQMVRARTSGSYDQTLVPLLEPREVGARVEAEDVHVVQPEDSHELLERRH